MEPHEMYAQACEAAAQGCYSEALQLLERCLADNPAHLPAHKEMAFVLRMMGNLDDALAHRLQVKTLDPSDLGNRYYLANLYFLMGEKQSALAEAQALLSIEPDNKRFYTLKDIITTSH